MTKSVIMVRSYSEKIDKKFILENSDMEKKIDIYHILLPKLNIQSVVNFRKNYYTKFIWYFRTFDPQGP